MRVNQPIVPASSRRCHLAINNQRITFTTELREAIVKHPDQPISISILRADSPMRFR